MKSRKTSQIKNKMKAREIYSEIKRCETVNIKIEHQSKTIENKINTINRSR